MATKKTNYPDGLAHYDAAVEASETDAYKIEAKFVRSLFENAPNEIFTYRRLIAKGANPRFMHEITSDLVTARVINPKFSAAGISRFVFGAPEDADLLRYAFLTGDQRPTFYNQRRAAGAA